MTAPTGTPTPIHVSAIPDPQSVGLFQDVADGGTYSVRIVAGYAKTGTDNATVQASNKFVGPDGSTVQLSLLRKANTNVTHAAILANNGSANGAAIGLNQVCFQEISGVVTVPPGGGRLELLMSVTAAADLNAGASFVAEKIAD